MSAEPTVPTIRGLTLVNGPFPINIEFVSRTVTGFDLLDLTVGNGTASDFTGPLAMGHKVFYVATITPASDGEVTVDIAPGAAQIEDGRDTVAAQRLTVMADLTPPTPSITGPTRLVKEPFPITIDFGEAVTGLEVGEITVGNGTASNLIATGNIYTATVTPTDDGQVTVNIPAGVAQDLALNPNRAAATSLMVMADLTPPRPTITGPTGTITSPFDITINFGEVVTGFDVANLRVGNGTAGNFSGSGASYTARITPTADGQVTVDIAAEAAMDAAGNDNEAAPQFSVTADLEPTVAIARPVGQNGPVTGDFNITITFSESVTGFDVDDLRVGNGTVAAGSFSGSGASYRATIRPTANHNGPVTVDIAANEAMDAGGNGNVVAPQFSVTADLVAPTVAIARPMGQSGPVNGAFDITITFSEAVTGFDVDDLRVSNGTVAAGSFSGSGASYRARITPTADGQVTVDIGANEATDAGGNGNAVAPQFSVTADQAAPTVAIARLMGESGPVNGDFDITITFSESVTGFDVGNLRVDNGTAGNFSGSGANYRATITPNQGFNRTLRVGVPGGVARDDAGNLNTATTSLQVVVDQAAPTPLIELAQGVSQPVNGEFNITIIFSYNGGTLEAVQDFEAEDLTVIDNAEAGMAAPMAKGTAKDLTDISAENFMGPGTFYRATITPNADFNGTLRIGVPRGVVRDNASNLNTAATPLQVAVDQAGPIPTIALATGESEPVKGDFDITITFSEAVTGFNADDLSVANGTAGNFSGSGASYTARITPSSEGPVTVDIAAEAAVDAAGNNNEAAPQFSVTADLVAPTVAIARPVGESGLVTGDFNITITFSESVTGFDVNDLSVGNGTVKAGSLSGSGASYTATITPTANHNGPVTVDIEANAVTDGASRGNTAAAQFSVTADQTAPTVAIARPVGDSGSVNGDFPITITFSEVVTGFEVGNLRVGNGTAGNFSGSGASYRARITPTANGQVTVDIAANVVMDAAGNSNTVAPQFSVTANGLSVAAPILAGPTQPVKGNSTFQVEIRFGEAVTGFSVRDLTLEGAELITLAGSAEAGQWTATLRPTINDGQITVTLAAGAVRNLAGNASTEARSTVTVDSSRPHVRLLTGSLRGRRVRSPFVLMVVFHEAVTGFNPSQDVTVVNATVAIDPHPNNQRNEAHGTYRLRVTPIADGPVTMTVAAGVVQDLAGNPNRRYDWEAGPLRVIGDTTAATPAISGPTGSVNGAFPIAIDFGEEVTGFEQRDLRVGNGTVSAFAGTGASYTAMVTPTGNGPVTVDIAAGAARDTTIASFPTPDGTGVPTLAATQFRVTADLAAPTIRGPAGPVSGAAFPITIEFAVSVTELTVQDLNVTNAVVTRFMSSNGNTWTAMLDPVADGTVGVEIPAGEVQDAFGIPIPVAAMPFTVEADVTAPTPTIALGQGVSAPANGAFPITVTFNEPVTNFELSDLTVGNGTVSGFSGSGQTYTATITPTAAGLVTVNIAAEAAMDAVGNLSLLAMPFTRRVGLAAPTPLITGPGRPVNGPFHITIDFRKRVTGFNAMDVSVEGASLSGFSGRGSLYTATLTPNSTATVVRVAIESDAAVDEDGNASLASEAYNVQVDRSVPRLRRVTGPTEPVTGDFDIYIYSGETSGGLQDSYIDVQNGSLVSHDIFDLGTDWGFILTIRPAADGLVTVDFLVKFSTWDSRDPVAGRYVVTADLTAPTPTITGPDGPVSGAFDVEIDFGEVVTGFDQSGLQVTNGSIELFTNPTDLGPYRVRIRPTADGEVRVQVPQGAAQDLASRSSLAATTPFTVMADLAAPTPTITGPSGPVREAFDIRIDFGEDVTGFDVRDLAVLNADLSRLERTGSDGNYVARLIPRAEGPVTVDIGAGAAVDRLDRDSLAAATYTATMDLTPPTPTITGVRWNNRVRRSFNININFDEDVTGFELIDLIVSNATAGSFSGSGRTYRARITSTTEGPVTVDINAGAAQDLAGNLSLAAARPRTGSPAVAVTADFTPPIVSITGPTAVSTPFEIDFVSNEGLVCYDHILDSTNRFSPSRIRVTNGQSMIRPGSWGRRGNSCFVTIRPWPVGSSQQEAVEGPLTVVLRPRTMPDLAGNFNTEGAEFTTMVDLTRPTPTITGPSGPIIGRPSFDITINFGEPVTDFGPSDLTLNNNFSLGAFTGQGQTYTATINAIGTQSTSLNTDDVVVSIATGAAQDLAGNPSAAAQLDLRIREPVLTLDTIAGDDRVNIPEKAAGFTFGGTVERGATLALTVGGQTLTPTINGTNWSATVPPNAGYISGTSVEVEVSLSLDSAVRTVSRDLALDLTAPTAEITSPASSVTSEFNITITFSESVTGFDGDDLTVGNGTVKADSFSGSGTTYTAMIIPSGDGQVTVDIAADAAIDAAGNNNEVAPQFSVTADIEAPTVGIARSVDESGLVTGDFNITITFSESVTGFDGDDLTVGNGTVKTDSFSGSGASYRATITPTANYNGPVTVDIPADAATDVANRGNMAAAQFSVTADQTAPTVAIARSVGERGPVNGDFNITITFSESVTGFDVNDLTVGNGTVKAGSFSGSGASYTATITLTANYSGAVTVDIAGDTAMDAAGNNNEAAPQFSVMADQVAPTVAIARSVGQGGLVTGPFNITITFSESVTGFDVNGLRVVNGTAGSFSGSGASYTAIITPSGDGQVTVDIAANAAMDAAGNGNEAATQFSVTVDLGAPTVAIVRSAGERGPVNDNFNITITFSESVTGFGVDDLTVGNGTVKTGSFSGSGASYTATITPTVNYNGPVTVDIAADAATDAVDRGNTAAAQFSVTADYTAPTVAIARSGGESAPVNGEFDITITFSEAVNNLVVGDLTVIDNADAGMAEPTVKGTAKDLTDISTRSGADPRTVYRATITPSADFNGTLRVGIPGGVATDDATNANTAATPLQVAVDQVGPTPTIAGPAGRVGASFPITITFGERVTGFVATGLTLDNAILTALTDNGDGAWTATLEPVAEGTVTVNVAEDAAQDLLGNDSLASAPYTVQADLTGPTPRIVKNLPITRDTKGPFEIHVEFNEIVTDFERSELLVGNGTVTAFSTLYGGRTYYATIAPTAEGPVTVDIAAGAALDQIGNESGAATQFSITADLTPPKPLIRAVIRALGLPSWKWRSLPLPTRRRDFDIIIDFGESTSPLSFDRDAPVFTNGMRRPGTRVEYGDNIDRLFVIPFQTSLMPGEVGTITVDLPAESADDWAGNSSLASEQFVVMFDRQAPTVTVTRTDGGTGPVKGEFDITITFSEAVTGFDVNGLNVANGTVGNFSGSGASYRATITPSGDGQVTVDIAANAAMDAARNRSEAAPQFSVTAGIEAPAVAIARPVGESGPVKGDFGITITFSESVTGFDVNDLSVGNGIVKVGSFSGSGASYTATITPTTDHNGAVTVDIAADAATDAASRGNIAAAQFSVTADQAAPTVAIARPVGESGPVTGPFNITITFSEAVTGFEIGNLRVENGTVGNFSGSGASYTATITPSRDGQVTVDIAANAATDAAGNGNAVAPQFSVTADIEAPTVAIARSLDESGPVNGDFDITITFSKSVTGFDVNDLSVGNGTVKVDSFSGSGVSYRATITPTTDHNGAVTVDIAADAATDAANRGNMAAAQFSVTADHTAPTVAIARPEGESGPVNGDFNITITFSESVTDFDLDDLTVGNGIVKTDSFSGSGASYTATIIPTANYSGAVTVDIAGNAAMDAAGNNNEAAPQFSVTADLEAPTVAIARSVGESGLVTGEFNITITFSEAVTEFNVDDLTVTNGIVKADSFSGSGASYRATITPTANYNGAVTVDIAANVAMDAADNGNEAAPQFSVTADQVAPTVAIARSVDESGLVTGDFNVTITFSEAVTGFDVNDLSVGNGIVKTGSFSGSGASYTATITPTANYNGTVTVDITADAATDAANLGNTAAVQFSVAADQTAPTVAIARSVDESGPVNGDFNITITFSEAVTEFDADDLTVGNGTVKTDSFSGSGASYTATITPTANYSGAVTVDIAANVAMDAAGNNNEAAPQFSVTADLAAPTVAIAGPTGIITGSFDITIIFSETVTGFGVDNLTVSNGTAWNFSGSGANYRVTITPTADGQVTVDIAANVAMDAAGNDNEAAPQFVAITRLVGPKIQGPTLVNGPFPINIEFVGQRVTGFDLLDLTVGNGTGSDFTGPLVMGDRVFYVATITPTSDGEVTVDMAPGAAQSEDGSDTVVAQRLTVMADLTPPTPRITGPTRPVKESFPITIDFGEAVTDFEVGEITVGNGTASNLTAMGNIYTATVTPTDDGQVTVNIPAGVAQDLALNPNPAAATPFMVMADLTPPRPTITGPTGTITRAFDITINFGEVVTGFDVANLRVGNGTAGNFSGSGASYTARITPTADGQVTVDIAASAAMDTAGNDNEAAPQFSVTANLEPTVAIARPVGQSGPVTGDFNIIITFSESVTGFEVDDLRVSNGTVAAGSFSGSAASYRVTITPTANYSGPVTVDIAANEATDAGGNGNAVAPQFSVTADLAAPTVAIARPAGESGPVTGDFDIIITFSEAVTGFDVGNLRVENGTAGNFSGSGASYTARITPSGDAQVTVDIAANAAMDAGGNGNEAAPQFSVTADVEAPTVAIARSVGERGPVNGDFGITIAFSKSVTGFDVNDLRVGNGTVKADSLSGSGASYAATITPTASYNGPVTVDIAADAATDAANRGNMAAAQFSVTADQTAPTVAIARPVGQSGPVTGDFDIIITFSEAVNDFVAGDLTVIDNGDAGMAEPTAKGTARNLTDISTSSSADPGTIYRATITPNADFNGTLRVGVPGGVATDDATNANTAASLLQVAVDQAGPVPTIALATGESTPVNGEFNITITFSEAVNDFVVGDVTVIDNGDAGMAEPTAKGTARDLTDISTSSGADPRTVYRATITPNADFSGTLRVGVPGGVATDDATNANTAATPLQVPVDQVGPTPTIAGPTGRVGSSFSITVTFGERVTGFVATDLTLDNAILTALTDNGDGVWTATLETVAEGTVTVNVAEGAVQDLLGNDSLASAPYTVRADLTGPTPRIVKNFPITRDTKGPFEIRVEFNETVTDFEQSEILVGNGTVTAFSTYRGRTYYATIAPTAEGLVTVDIAAGAALDQLGNESAAVQFSITADLTPPKAVISAVIRTWGLPPSHWVPLPLPTRRQSFDIIIDFGESTSPLSFDEDAPVFTNGMRTPGTRIRSADNHRVFAIPFQTSLQPGEVGTITVDLPAGSADDWAGNSSLASEQFVVMFDHQAPTVTVTRTDGGTDPVKGEFDITITFSEAVTGFDVNGLNVANGTVGNFSGSGASYTATITPSGSGQVTVDIAADVAMDPAGNNNEAAPQLSVTADQVAPTVAIARSVGESGPANGDFDITIAFSESVTGFDVNDLTVGNGTVKAGSFSGSGASYTATITPTANYSGAVTVDIAGNVAMDAAANNNEAAPQFSVTVDQVAPTVAIARSVGQSRLVTAPFNIAITFSESVTGFDVNGLRVANGTVGNFSGSGASYRARITPSRDGQVTVDIAASAAMDAAGNGNQAAPQFSVTADLAAPTVAIARSLGESGPVNGDFNITITFSESVTGFGVDDLNVGNGTVKTGSFSGSGASYRATITPTPNYNGTVTVDIAADAATGAASRGNVAAAQFSVTADHTAPTVVIARPVGQSGPVNGDFNITITFSESVTGFDVDDLRVGNGTVKAGSFSGSGASYTATITPTANYSGTVTVDIAGNVAMDAAGNNNEAAPQFSVTADQVAPTVAIARPVGESGTVTGDFNITITFSESVTGFDVNDLRVGNGIVKVGSFSGSGASYTATITPTANYSGEVTVDIAGSVAMDAAGNNNEAATQLSVTADLAAPTVVIGRPTGQSGPVTGEFNITITFSESVTGFVLTDLTVINGTASNFSGSGASYTATITPTTDYNGPVMVDIAAAAAQDLVGNNSPVAARYTVMVGANDNTPVSIPDATLRILLQVELRKGGGDPILRSELAGLTSLRANNHSITDLTGLEYATGLTILTIGRSSASDISALSGLAALETLNLNGNRISDLTPLSGLTALRTLKLRDNHISDIALLVANSGLGSGDTINLRGNAATLNAAAYNTHIPALQSRGVTVLLDADPHLARIPDANLRRALEGVLNKRAGDPILRSELAGLTSLRAENRSIGSLRGLQHATGLTELFLGRNSVSDISALSGLTALQTLNLNGNSISDIAPLVANTGLGSGDTINLRGNAATLNAAAYDTHIPALQGRGVTVQFDPRPATAQLVTAPTTEEDVAISIRAVEPSVMEGEPAQFQLTAVPAPRTDLVVAITVADPDGALTDTAPTQVIIPANQSTALFELETDDDEVDELDAMVTVTLEAATNADYTIAEAPDNSASVTVMDNDGLTQERREEGIEHALGAFGRATGWDLVETIRERSRTTAGQGQAFEITNLPSFDASGVDRPRPTSMNLFELLERDAEVRVTFNPQVAQASESGSSNKSPLLRAWLKANRTDLRSDPFEGRTQEGKVTTGRLGVDVAYDSGWLVGSVFSWHDGNIEFDDSTFSTEGEVDIELFSINPYVSLTKGRLHLWGTIGGGLGTLSYEDSPTDDPTSTSSDLRMLTAAAGAEYAFGRLGPFDLKGRGEGAIVNMKAEDSSHALVGYDDIGVTVYGVRGELELGLPVNFDSNRTEFRPYVFTGVRQDAGLGNDLALEYGGGFALRTGSLVAEGSIRSQFGRDDDAVKLTGYSISLAYDRGNDRKGLVAKVEQSAGPSDYDPYGVGTLSSFAGETATRFHLGYGIGWDEQLLRPFVEMDWQESQRSGLDIGLEYQYGDGSANLGYSDGELNLGFRFEKLF